MGPLQTGVMGMDRRITLLPTLAFCALMIAGCTGPAAPQEPQGGGQPQGQVGGQAYLVEYLQCISYCEEAWTKEGMALYGCRDDCRMTAAEKSGDASYCDETELSTSPGACYGNLARKSGDMSYCANLTNESVRNLCELSAGFDEEQ